MVAVRVRVYYRSGEKRRGRKGIEEEERPLSHPSGMIGRETRGEGGGGGTGEV